MDQLSNSRGHPSGQILEHILGDYVPGLPKVHPYGIVWQQLALIPGLDEIHNRLIEGELDAEHPNQICDAYGIVVSGKRWTSNSSSDLRQP